MKCGYCNSTMTCLFISWVCDTCNPPGEPDKINLTEPCYGWVPFHDYSDDVINNYINAYKRVSCYIFETRDDAVKAAVKMKVLDAKIKKVVSKNKINYDDVNNFHYNNERTYLVPREDLDIKQDGHNIVSLTTNKEEE